MVRFNGSERGPCVVRICLHDFRARYLSDKLKTIIYSTEGTLP